MKPPIWLCARSKHRVFNRPWILILLINILASYLSGCDTEVKGIMVPELSVRPSMLYIGNPAGGESFSTNSLTLTNISNFNIIITELRLEEEDELKELTIVEAEQWDSTVMIRAGESRNISIMWRSQDEQRDLATLTIISNAGEQTIGIETEPPRARLAISSMPEVIEVMEQKRIKFASSALGGSQKAVIRIKSLGLLPLRVNELCLSINESTCFKSLNHFKLCEGTNATSDNCLPLLERGGLNLGEERVFSVLFEPNATELKTSKVDLRVSTNAYMQQAETIALVGIPCMPTAEDESCRPFHYLEAGTLTIGSQQMTSESGQKLDGELLPASHLSYDSKLNLYLKGNISP